MGEYMSETQGWNDLKNLPIFQSFYVMDELWHDLNLDTKEHIQKQVSFILPTQTELKMTCIEKISSIQLYWKFYNQKTENFQIKSSHIFHIFAQNIYCGYSLEPPVRGDCNEHPQSVFNKKEK